MAKTLRLPTDFPEHPGVLRLVEALGDKGFRCFLTLVCRASEHKLGGVFDGLKTVDVEAMAWWDGQYGLFVKACVEAELLEIYPDGAIAILNWNYYSPWSGSQRGPGDPPKKFTRAERKAFRDTLRRAQELAGKAPDPVPEDTSPGVIEEMPPEIEASDIGASPLTVLQAWNKMAKPRGIPRASRLGPSRRKRVLHLLNSGTWNWQGALTWMVANIPTLDAIKAGRAMMHPLQGDTKRATDGAAPWKANFDWFTRSREIAESIILGQCDREGGPS